MKKLIPFVVLGALFITLIGCPYDAKVALNTYEESGKLNKKYYGDFTNSQEDGSKHTIQITKGMKQVYNIRHRTIDEKGQKME